jgi:deoxyribodipyrimidine photo-lyase
MSRIFWFRRDLRLQDNEALTRCAEAAISDGDSKVLGCFNFEQGTFETLSGIRQHSIVASLESLNNSMSGALQVLEGEAAEALARLSQRENVEIVHATESFDPAGILEQEQVAKSLAALGKKLVLEGSNYAVTPGAVVKPTDGSAYRVYTPFYKAWFEIGWPEPFKLPTKTNWVRASEAEIPRPTKPAQFKVRAGEQFALETFERFKKRALFDYSENRNRADLSGTSKLSHALAHGEIHPRTLLSDLRDTDGHNVFRKEIAWREFYADVLFRNPHTVNDYYVPRFSKMRYDTGQEADQKLERWKQGTTGFPMIDAGMRQLATEGWMHNRVRMIVASFLVKDLHLEWQLGADWFEQCLSDFDPASNSHGWQWTAGCGTDASPYYRVFNPILQGYKFDPDGNYVRRYIPELSHLDGPEVHEPWLLVDGLINGYPEPMLDHSQERDESLRRLEEIKEK